MCTARSQPNSNRRRQAIDLARQQKPDRTPRVVVGATIQVAMPSGDQKALPVLSDQEAIKKAGGAHFSQDLPWQGNQKGEQSSPQPRHFTPDSGNASGNNRPNGNRNFLNFPLNCVKMSVPREWVSVLNAAACRYVIRMCVGVDANTQLQKLTRVGSR